VAGGFRGGARRTSRGRPGRAHRRILADLQRRDHLDSTRKVAPLRIADDAVVVHSDGRSFDETVDRVVDIIRAYAERAEAEAPA
jgi:cytidylate kinase